MRNSARNTPYRLALDIERMIEKRNAKTRDACLSRLTVNILNFDETVGSGGRMRAPPGILVRT